ncbi:double-strand break repair helicase AddA [Phenylobacterium montanum]|uniref:DNA 3'-5' helicase n=1 Tax=Phenylobacterium montanum TaxID=2823693 RepID=A0A975FXS4_9CAUL|nr:double-strand break repair helicase AddA [Caulobacter sp. S6]QUD86261.1 double-strand break repair helicase AddA [Caulobacter sp. S6]
MTTLDPQVLASDPKATVFVTANAGSGKTSTLVKRVARLLLQGARPEAILCVTYTKAAAAEMQRRLFEELGGWAVAEDEPLARKLAELDEQPSDLSAARALFARALETPGGLKIQTIHAFCEKLLRRFPLEAGVSPGFQVLEDAVAAQVSDYARDAVAELAKADPNGPVGRAYRHFSVELDWRGFLAMFTTFEAKRAAIRGYIEACPGGAYGADVWGRCGFDLPTEPERLEAEAVAGIAWPAWRRAAEALAATGAATDGGIAEKMRAAGPKSAFAVVWAAFATAAGEPRAKLGTNAVDPAIRDWLKAEQDRLHAVIGRLKAARIARDTVHALSLALAYAEVYDGQKQAAGGLDFGDLIARTEELLTRRADAAWVLYKLDGGIDHILLDEAQDTAPEQWEILSALTEEFFAGSGVGGLRERTLFAVGDKKQSIYSFQGAAPERLAAEYGAYEQRVGDAGRLFRGVPLEVSWRSTPEVLAFVDAVFAAPETAVGLQPGEDVGAGAIRHTAKRPAGRGAVDLWPLEEAEPEEERDPWLPVDLEPKESANKKLARRIARSIKASIERGEAVLDRESREWRPARAGDFLILVRRRKVLFHEIIRALKREGVPVGGADRLQLSEHIVFQDLMALGRFCRFTPDDLTLAALLRSPFCEVDEDSLFALAHRRETDLWTTLNARATERAEWERARDFFAWALAEAQLRSPFDFFGRVLSRLDAEGRSMRQRMLTRLGREAEDAIDAFMGQALSLEQRGLRDLERFLDAMAAADIEVKREQEDTSGREEGEVRVMTTHGAKGLEAPIVFLPDTTTRATAQGGPLLDAEGGGFLWAPRKAEDCEASARARAAREASAAGESLRLLYVALTRARDRLVICGTSTRDTFYKGSWCDVAARAFERPEIAEHTRLVGEGEAQVTRFGFDPVLMAADATAARVAAVLPAWVYRFAPAEPASRRYASPSTLAEEERGPSSSPLAARQGLGRYRRGLLVHRLLQLLPDLPLDERAEAAAMLLLREPDLTPDQREEMASAALAVLEDARFAAVFGPGSRAEVAVAGAAPGLPEGLAISGRIDRLVVEKDRVLVVDYKTNRPAPRRIEEADRAYRVQMALYAAVLAEVFPGRLIEAALVWTDGPKLMPVPGKMITETLAELRANG